MAYAAAGKRVLITGASAGLGAAMARQLAAQNAVVGLIARRRNRLSEVLADCRRTSPASAMWVADLGDTAGLAELAMKAWDGLGGIDVLINNAAIPKRRPVTELDPDEVEDVMRVNFFAPMRMTLTLLPADAGARIRSDRQHLERRRTARDYSRNCLLCKQIRALRVE
jgi:short-subunit dehydrogenase